MTFCRRAQASFARVLYFAAGALLRGAGKCLWPGRRPLKARRVCVYRIGNIGDIICAVPAMYAIRQAYPAAQLTLVTSPGTRGLPGAKELLTGADWLQEVVVYYADEVATSWKRLALVRDLRRRAFDVWIELPNDLSTLRVVLRNMCMARLAGAKWAYGWRINSIRWAAQAQSDYLHFPNEVERLLAVIAGAGIEPAGTVFALPLQREHIRAVDELLREHGLSDAASVALSPGAKRSTNRWPAERFAEVGCYLTRKGFRVLLIGDNSDRGVCQEIVSRIGRHGVNLAGKTSLLEACELLRRCCLVICNDSGVQHLAAAVGTPCISLFSCWQIRGKWWPYGSGNTVLQKWVECHTCFLETCPYDNRCIKLIDCQDVVRSIDEKIKELNASSYLAPPCRKEDRWSWV